MNFPSSETGTTINTLDNWANVKAHIGAKKKTIDYAFVINCLNNVENCCPFEAPSGNFQGDICGTLTYNNPKNVALYDNGGRSFQSGREDSNTLDYTSAKRAIDGATTCESTNDYDSFHDRACVARNELAVWEYDWATQQYCEDRCSENSRCTSFEHRPSKQQRKHKCQLSSSCFNDLGYDTSSNGDWTLYQKKDCFSTTGSGGIYQWWRLKMPENYNHKVRKVVVWVPQDEASDEMIPFAVRGWNSAPSDLRSEGGSSQWNYSHGSSENALDSANGWKAEISVSEDVYLNRIEIRKDDGNPVRLAEVQVYIEEVLTSSTLPSKADYQAAILTAMRNKVNEVTSDVEACYSEQCG
jgi:hypothetical protein